jgi:hypothetical protein
VIPAFDSQGVLPIGRYPATVAEIESRFVHTFPASMTRAGLFDGWRARREELLDLVSIEWEWVDGSFVTSKSNAGDIDVATFIQSDLLDEVDPTQRQRIFELTVGSYPLITFGCHSFLVVIFKPPHPLHPQYLAQVGYWDRQWTADRSVAGKGYIEVREVQ